MVQFSLIALIILFYTFQSLFSRLYTDNYPGDKSVAPSVFAIVCGLVVSIVSFAFSGFTFEGFRWETLVLGLVNAVILYGYDEFIIKASASGPYSILMVFNLGGGIIFPAIAKSIIPYTGGTVQVITWVQIIAIIVICVAVYMVSYKKDDNTDKQNESTSKVFLFFCIALALCNGLYGILFDVQDQLTGPGQKQLMVIYTFVGAAILGAINLFVKRKKGATKGKDAPGAFTQTKKSLIYLLLASFVSAMAINILVLLVGQVNLTLLYTFDNAGVMLLSALASALLFKEKLSPLNIGGCAVMTVGLILMGAYDIIGSFISGLFA